MFFFYKKILVVFTARIDCDAMSVCVMSLCSWHSICSMYACIIPYIFLRYCRIPNNLYLPPPIIPIIFTLFEFVLFLCGNFLLYFTVSVYELNIHMAVCPYAARFQSIAIELSDLIMLVHHCYPKILALYNVRGADMIQVI